MLTISEINIFPVKSLRGISLQSAKVTDRGFQHDRRWMLINKDGNFMTQRDYPQMAFVNTELTEEGIKVYHRKKELSSFLIPFEPKKKKKLKVPIWDDTCEALLVGKDADKWFTEVLDVECRLVFQPDKTKRKVDKKYSHGKEIVSFADGYPFLIIGQASLDNLNSRMEIPLPMNRFRTNLVFTGGEPFEEDNLKKFKIGDIVFYGVKPCARCVITTTNQETAERLAEPLKTLATFRKVENKVLFGMNLISEGEGEINVGDIIDRL